MQQSTGGDGAREAARLRYELARLHDRRTVRAALALGELRRSGLGPALSALRGRAPRLDMPGPAQTPPRLPFPHLRVVHTGDGHLLRSTSAHERMDPATAGTLLRRERPDLVLIDGVTGWSASRLQALRRDARDARIPVVALGGAASTAVPDADLSVSPGRAGPSVSSGGAASSDPDPAVVADVRTWSPAGLQDTIAAHRRDDAAAMTPGDARRQPVVVVPDVDVVGIRRCLELLAAGALVVSGPSARLDAVLDPLGGEVVGSAATLDDRAAALLGDDERRRRTSVRLRRHVHRHLSTRAALIGVVEALGIDQRPSERVSVLLPTRRPQRLAQVVEDLAIQRHAEVELIVLPHGPVTVPDGLAGIARVQPVDAERPLGAVLNVGLDLATGAYVAKVDDDDRYGPNHLADQVLALHHSGAEVVGRRIHGVYDEAADETVSPPAGGEERFEDHLPGGTLLLPADALREVRWRHVPRAVDTELVRAIHLAGGSAYSGHRYGYVRVRHGDHLYEPDVEWDGVRTRGLDASLLDA